MSVEFENNILKVKAALDKCAEKFLVEAGSVLKAQAQQNTAVDKKCMELCCKQV